MDQPKSEILKLPNMVMCGDHPSVTKTEVIKDHRFEGRDKTFPNYKIEPSTSRTEKSERPCSDEALRAAEARRRGRSTELVPAAAVNTVAAPNRALVQAALGSFRWPPYLLAVWVLVLLLTHALHAATAVLERTLPTLKNFCLYLRGWTEDAWRSDVAHHRLLPIGLGFLTGLFYLTYCTLYVAYAVSVWATEPLYADSDEGKEERVTDYEEGSSKVNIK